VARLHPRRGQGDAQGEGDLRRSTILIWRFLPFILAAMLPGLAAADAIDDMIAMDRTRQNFYAIELIAAKARAGDGLAQLLIGEHLLRGDVGVRNIEEASIWLKRAADNGQAMEAGLRLGNLYELGRDVPRGTAEAARWYERSVEAGSACAARDLAGLHLRERDGNAIADRHPWFWYERCAEMGLHLCQEHVGWHYFGENYARSLAWLMLSLGEPNYRSISGTARIQAAVGFQYQHGLGVAKNLAEALRWYSLAIDNESGYANFAMAEFEAAAYPARAAELYQAAAERQYKPAQYKLGLAYRRGEGVARDPVQAAKWLILATKQSADDPVDVALFERDPIRFGFESEQLDPATRTEALSELASLRRNIFRDQFATAYAQALKFEPKTSFPAYCGPHGCPDCW
jgi:TPR repeat protein